MIRIILSLLFSVFAITSTRSQIPLLDSIIHKDSLRALVGYLASDSMCGRFSGSVYANNAAMFIANAFYKAGAKPVKGNRGYFIPILNSLGNVMAALPGKTKPNEIIIFCAHYDHIGTTSTADAHLRSKNDWGEIGDTIYNGANDNATGVSAVISLARYFSKLNTNERTILFIAFSGEELGLLGSRSLSFTISPLDVKAVINIEMIGRPITRNRRNAYMTGDRLSNLQKILNNQLNEIAPDLYGKKFFANDRFTEHYLFQRSDNYWFAHKGIPAHTIMSTPPDDRYYHTLNDEISTLDFDLMAHLTKAIANGCKGLIDGTQTPTRINPRLLSPR